MAGSSTLLLTGVGKVAAVGGGFDPLTLSPHVLLDPDNFGLVDGDPVGTAVNDGSLADFTQATSAARPTLRGGASLLNGHFVVEHDAVDDVLNAPDLSALTNATAFLVVKIDNDPPAGDSTSGLWHFGTSSSTYYSFSGDGKIYEQFGTNARKDAISHTGVPLNAWRIYEVRSASGDWEARLDGSVIHSTPTNTVAFNAAPRLGAMGAGSGNWLDGRWAWHGIFPALSSGDATSVRGYLQTRFGL